MKNQKKFFFNKEDNAIKELLDSKTMHNIVGGLKQIIQRLLMPKVLVFQSQELTNQKKKSIKKIKESLMLSF